MSIISSLVDGSRAGSLLITAGVYLLTLAALVVAVRRARHGDLTGVGCLLGAFAVSWGEAFYDAVFHLAFYSRGMTLWSPFGIDQPWWVPAGYTAGYGLSGWLVAERVAKSGTSRATLTRCLLASWLGCAGFETIAYRLGVLRYYDNAMTVWGMPYWHEMFNAVFIVIAGVAVAAVRPVLADKGPAMKLATPMFIFLIGFPGITYGTGFAALLAHNTDVTPGIMWGAALASNVLAILVLWVTAELTSRHRAARQLGRRPSR